MANKQSNPLKYFNDEKAKRVAKLTKAQEGYTTLQGPITREASQEIESMSRPTYPDFDTKKMSYVDKPKSPKQMASSQDRAKKIADANRNPNLKIDSSEYDKAAYFKKSGGQTKSKKK